MRAVVAPFLAAVALVLVAPSFALAGGGGHVRAILTLDPPAPRAGDTVIARLEYLRETAPPTDSITVVRPDARSLTVSLARTSARSTMGTFFVDRAGTWRAYVGGHGMSSALTIEASGPPGVVIPAPSVTAGRIPGELIAALVVAPYALLGAGALAVWAAIRAPRRTRARPAVARTPAPSYG